MEATSVVSMQDLEGHLKSQCPCMSFTCIQCKYHGSAGEQASHTPLKCVSVLSNRVTYLEQQVGELLKNKKGMVNYETVVDTRVNRRRDRRKRKRRCSSPPNSQDQDERQAADETNQSEIVLQNCSQSEQSITNQQEAASQMPSASVMNEIRSPNSGFSYNA